MKFMLKLFFLVLFCCPAVALAELPELVQSDFAVLEGVVVMPINDEYIVTLEDREDLHIGDILTLVNPGKKVFHPETKELIGSIDEVVGFLQVSRIHSGYSYAKVVTEDLKPEAGAQFKRFEQVPAFLKTAQEADPGLARQLQVNLPQFQWLEEDQADLALLSFDLQAKSLDVRTVQGDSLHKYKVTEDQQLVTTVTSAPRPYTSTQAEPKSKPLQQLANALIGTISQTNEDRFAEMDEAIIRQRQIDREGIWMGPNLAGHPIGLSVADLDGDGQQEVAVLLEKKIVVARIIEGEFGEVAEVPLPGVLKFLSIDALDLDNNGRSELYLSALAGDRPSSFVVEYDGGNYSIVIDSVRWLLRAVNLSGEISQSLVGQRVGNIENVFRGDVFHVARKGTELVQGEAIALPENINLFNFTTFTDDKQQVNYAYLTNGDYLKVVSGSGEDLWESAGYFGGSEDDFNLSEKRRDDDPTLTYMPPRMVLMPGHEILVAQNDGQRMVQRFRRFKQSRIVSLAWNGFSMTENWQTASQQGYLGDFTLADADNDGNAELVMAIKFKHGGLTEAARASIVIYELE